MTTNKNKLSHPSQVVQSFLDQIDLLEVKFPQKPSYKLKKRRARGLTLFSHMSRITRPQVEKFLSHYADTGNVTESCEVSGIGYRNIYHLRDSHPVFARIMDDVGEIATDRLEAEARRRAMVGVRKPVVSKGVIVTHVQEYSDRLMERLLEANRAKFRPKVDHNMSGTVSVQYQITGLDPVKKAIDVTPEVSEMATKRQPQAEIPAKTEEKGK